MEILPELEIEQLILEKESESPKDWREAYQVFIDDWKQIGSAVSPDMQ